ncbi:DUF2627 family protein [Virgibacillus byunsanensis]|uniref:DUF2627 family protein n=1 Tax=Virgibacillus byunsanensis TaxID=570945 RepID=A0ABW3LPB7_9BACI
MVRFIAILILIIPGVFSAYGIKLMRDSLFDDMGFQFLFGLLFFIIGIAFIGGFIVHRDKKKQLNKKKNVRKRKGV